MRILLTGHKGFIGSKIYETLKNGGYEIEGVDMGDKVPDAKL